MFLVIVVSVLLGSGAEARVPVKLSIKFILDEDGNRPATGRLNTDTQINAEINAGDDILKNNITEYSIDVIEFVDLPGVSQYYSSDANETNRDNLRTDAMNNESLYMWRHEAVNIYINGGSGAAISKFPPDNDIILMNQGCTSIPSCILHELGHSLNLKHTHEAGGDDGCSDTIDDDEDWTKDEVAQNNFGALYEELTPSQKHQVDMVYNNIMSYHADEPQLRISQCQMNRMSAQADSDRSWVLSRKPIYVNSTYIGPQTGRFLSPYSDLQTVIESVFYMTSVIVLENGNYSLSTDIDDYVDIVTRSGSSDVDPPGVQRYWLPVDLENSKTPQVRSAIKDVQREDSAARKTMKKAKEDARVSVTDQERESIMAKAASERMVHENNALMKLIIGEQYAAGKEKISIQLELAERYRDSDNCREAIRYFQLVANGTKQIYLKKKALSNIERCQITGGRSVK